MLRLKKKAEPNAGFARELDLTKMGVHFEPNFEVFCICCSKLRTITAYLLHTKSEAEHKRQPPLRCLNVVFFLKSTTLVAKVEVNDVHEVWCTKQWFNPSSSLLNYALFELNDSCSRVSVVFSDMHRTMSDYRTSALIVGFSDFVVSSAG